jgi:hypothetical protein
MTLLHRELICERLRLGLRSSYRVVPPSRLSLINSDEVLEVLNRARRGGMKPLRDIPPDLRTPEEMASEIEGVTARMLLTWSFRRTKNVPPHFYINRHCVRFSASRLLAWLDERSRSCRKRVA